MDLHDDHFVAESGGMAKLYTNTNDPLQQHVHVVMAAYLQYPRLSKLCFGRIDIVAGV